MGLSTYALQRIGHEILDRPRLHVRTFANAKASRAEVPFAVQGKRGATSKSLVRQLSGKF